MFKVARLGFALLGSLALALPLACGDDDEEPPAEPTSCDPLAVETGCHENRACERVAGGEGRCFDAYYIVGRVFDTGTDEAIEGARVVARNVDGAAVSGVAVTNAEGEYKLQVPVPRNEDGSPSSGTLDVLLRADADGYLSFPKPPRTAIPLDIITADGSPPTIRDDSRADIGLVPIEETGFGTISGKVLADQPGGTLLVATGGATAVADLRGEFTLFNVPAGSVTVRGYLTGVNLEEKTIDVVADEATGGVEIAKVGDATASVSGSLSFVNPGSGVTSVILAVKETFNAESAKGETPPGLKVEGVTGPFTIENVPDGDYYVLAAFDNDGFVRDPDTSIAGTGLVEITVAGSDVAVPTAFKVTGALGVIGPDDGETVTSAPTFEWEDDSSEKRYELQVFDARGNLTWEKLDIPGVSGSSTVTQVYEGPPLEPGMIYQFRAVSWSSATGGTPLSSTEDLKGIFAAAGESPDAGASPDGG